MDERLAPGRGRGGGAGWRDATLHLQMRMRRPLFAVAFASLLGAACSHRETREGADASPTVAATVASSEPSPSGIDASTGVGDASPPSSRVGAGVVAIANADAGAAGCKLLRGPLAQPFNGPSMLRMVERAEGQLAELVVNVGGSPRFYDILPGDSGAPPQLVPPKSSLPSCAAARDTLFCPDATGAIHRSRGAGEGDTIVARSRPGTDVSAAALGAHVLVAYIAERTTTEGLVREAWLVADDGAPMRLSEEGSGATFVELATRGDAVVSMTIDARVAMTPAHARIVTLEGGAPRVGPDAVIFVGGSAERHNAGALATSKDGSAFALVAVSNDVARFGMAAIKIDEPPRDDAPVVWSLYPNGLDPAPIAATRGAPVMSVARVRPKGAEPGSPRVLELGVLDPSGTFRPRCTVAEASFVKDVELESDRQGTLWVFYREPGGTRLARIGEASAR